MAVIIFATSCARYVPIPEHLTRPCLVVVKQNDSVEEAVRLANDRLDSVADCNQRIRQISEIQGKRAKKE